MEDSLSYLNAVSQASSALNQITALKEQAQMALEQKEEASAEPFKLGGEISFTTAGAYLGKKALGYISEKLGTTVSDVASKVGISEETVGKALSGDISGAIEQGGQELAGGAESMIGQAISGVTTTAETMAGQLASAGESVISEATQSVTGILGRVSSGLENMPSLNVPSITPETSISDVYSQGLDDLRSQMGIDEASFREYTNVSLNEARPFSFNNVESGGQEIEMNDIASQVQPTSGVAEATTAEATAEATTAETAGSSVGESVGTSVGEAVAETAGAEVGADVASAVLGPIGGLIALGLGLWSFFHGEHEETAPTPPPVYVANLNPSSQFGAESA